MAELPDYKRDFIELMLEAGVLTFGDFVTKSGRRTPYFINAGNFNDGYRLARLGSFYAAALMRELRGDFDNLYGPAYKGIPLASVTAAALYLDHGRRVSYTFNRKETKDHGEGGVLVGYQYRGGEKVVIIEDVITAGTSVRETVPRLQAARVTLRAHVVSVDRQERGQGARSALQEVRAEFSIAAFAIVTLDEIVAYLRAPGPAYRASVTPALLDRILAYRREYGAAAD